MTKRDLPSWLSLIVGAALLAALTTAIAGPALAADLNSCGCSQDPSGGCYCERKAKCGCPGECEPNGCAEKREKQLQKEVDAETKKAAATDRKRQPERTEDGAAKPTRSEHKMTAADQRSLVRLLDLYVEEHPEARHETIQDVRTRLGLGDRPASAR